MEKKNAEEEEEINKSNRLKESKRKRMENELCDVHEWKSELRSCLFLSMQNITSIHWVWLFYAMLIRRWTMLLPLSEHALVRSLTLSMWSGKKLSDKLETHRAKSTKNSNAAFGDEPLLNNFATTLIIAIYISWDAHSHLSLQFSGTFQLCMCVWNVCPVEPSNITHDLNAMCTHCAFDTPIHPSIIHNFVSIKKFPLEILSPSLCRTVRDRIQVTWNITNLRWMSAWAHSQILSNIFKYFVFVSTSSYIENHSKLFKLHRAMKIAHSKRIRWDHSSCHQLFLCAELYLNLHCIGVIRLQF